MIVHVCWRTRAAISADEDLVRPTKKKKKKKKRQANPEEFQVPERAPLELPTPTTNAMALAAALAAAAVALLPLWDATGQSDNRMRALGFAVGAVVGGYALFRLTQSAPYGARALFALMALASVAYAGLTASEIALRRSQEIDAWPVCETGLDVRGNLVPNLPAPSTGYDGPRLANGVPCTGAAERRDEHAERSPEGNIQDGLIQVGIRFSQDRARIFAGTLAAVLALIASGVIVARAARAVD
jgi:hypothetical protein